MIVLQCNITIPDQFFFFSKFKIFCSNTLLPTCNVSVTLFLCSFNKRNMTSNQAAKPQLWTTCISAQHECLADTHGCLLSCDSSVPWLLLSHDSLNESMTLAMLWQCKYFHVVNFLASHQTTVFADVFKAAVCVGKTLYVIYKTVVPARQSKRWASKSPLLIFIPMHLRENLRKSDKSTWKWKVWLITYFIWCPIIWAKLQ